MINDKLNQDLLRAFEKFQYYNDSMLNNHKQKTMSMKYCLIMLMGVSTHAISPIQPSQSCHDDKWQCF